MSSNPPDENARDAVVKTPPNPLAPKPKPKVGPMPAVTKAQHAALKRADKTVIKRMRKR